MTLLHGKNYGRPTLDLNFAENKSLIDTVTGRNLITFSRSQSGKEATYVGSDGLIKYASADEPRFDYDPETGESLGLLVEEARTNLETYSELFTDVSWIKTDSSISPNATLSPDGLLNGAKVVENTNNAVHGIYKNYSATLTAGVKYTHTVFAKAGERSTLQLSSSQGTDYANFDLLNGVITFSTAGSNASIVALPNGWYRCSSQFTPPSTALVRPYILVYSTSNPPRISSYVGDGTSGIYVWGAQLEAGSFPTSYIPTTGTVVTRTADVASITGTDFSSWYNQSEGTVLCSYKSDSILTATNFPRIYAFNAIAGGSNTFQTIYVTAGKMNILVYADSGSLLRVENALNAETSGITGFSYKTNESVGFINGTLSTQGRTSAPTNTDIIRLDIGGDSDFPTRILNGTISRLTYWPKRLPDLELQQLTK